MRLDHLSDRPSARAVLTSPTTPAPVYRVWAPRAQVLLIEIDGERLPMTRVDGGWWVAERPMETGALYGYVIDGEGPFPDPRSMSQPAGVHGLSQVVDHQAFAWGNARWQGPPLASAVIYELHVGTFTEEGTFDAAVARLPHLADLGVTHVELMPVVEFPGGRGWGYDGVDLYAPHRAYGGPSAMKRFVDACHQAGLAVLLDVVYNHLGPSGNYLERFGPYFTSRYSTPWGAAINLDGPGSDEVRRFICDNAVMWLREYHIDGLRLDAVHALYDMSARHLLEQLSEEVETFGATSGRHVTITAESDLNDPRLIRSRDAGGYGLHAQWSDDFHHALHGMLTGERRGYYEDFGSMRHFAVALQRAFVYAGSRSTHRDRAHGRAVDGLPGWRFIVAAQNHDQVGNRAFGERLCHLVSERRARIAAALLMAAPFVPLLFQGEEWGATTPFQYFSAHDDPELARLVSEGRRNEFAAFGWQREQLPDPQDAVTFGRCRLRWDERHERQHAELFAWYRALIALRRDTPSLRDGNFGALEVTMDDEQRRLLVRRGLIVIACNLADQTAHVSFRDDPAAALLLGSDDTARLEHGALVLPADSVVFVAVSPGAPLPCYDC